MRQPNPYVFLISLFAAITWVAFFGSNFGRWTGPVMMLITFFANYYAPQIDQLARKIGAYLFGTYNPRTA